jgi:hemerythrin superfamily protein
MSDSSLAASSDTKNVVTMLAEDHERMLSGLLQFRDARDGTERKAIVDNVMAELETHSLLEEEFVFPAVRRLAVDESIVDLAEAGHREAEGVAEELQEVDPSDERFATLFNELTEQITQHIRHEEGDLLDRLQTLGVEELVELGRKMSDRRDSLWRELQEHGPEAPASVAGAS